MAIKKRLGKFSLAYIIFALVLALLVAAALIYVNSVLDEYEAKHPTRLLEKALVLLEAEASDGTLFAKEGAPGMIGGEFEAASDPKAEFLRQLGGEVKFTAQRWTSENECTYGVASDGFVFAEVTLRKIGEPVTKLAIISIQEYELVSYLPVSHTYTLELPADVVPGKDVDISVNGKTLTEEEAQKSGSGALVFTFSDIYTKPEVLLYDTHGNKSKARIPDTKDGKLEFESTFCTLTLPSQLSVDLDGTRLEGDKTDDGRYLYRIRLARKAKVELSDLFGNKIEYTGASNVPLTCYTLMTSDGCTVKVNGSDVPDSVMEISSDPEYKNFADLVTGLPRLPVYYVVVLDSDAEVTVTDRNGENVPLDPGKIVQDLTGASAPEPLDKIPSEVSSAVDVLSVLEDWSLFMSCDLDFASLAKHLVYGSYQYNIAHKYNYSVDRTFTSIHALKNPAFSGERVGEFVWLTDNCFSVRIRFVKHMIVSGRDLDDEMDERCYFVKDADGKWKLVGMKEVLDDAR